MRTRGRAVGAAYSRLQARLSAACWRSCWPLDTAPAIVNVFLSCGAQRQALTEHGTCTCSTSAAIWQIFEDRPWRKGLLPGIVRARYGGEARFAGMTAYLGPRRLSDLHNW